MPQTSPDGSAPIREIENRDLPALVDARKRVFPESFLTIMGEHFLKRYFGTLIADEETIALRTPSEGDVEGYVLALGRPERVYGQLQDKKLELGLRAIPGLIRNPGGIRDVVTNLRRLSSYSQGEIPTQEAPERYVELAEIGVRPSARGEGLGSALMAELVSRTAESESSRIFLYTEVDNEGARSFYRDHGFELTGRENAAGDRRMVILERQVESFQADGEPG